MAIISSTCSSSRYTSQIINMRVCYFLVCYSPPAHVVMRFPGQSSLGNTWGLKQTQTCSSPYRSVHAGEDAVQEDLHPDGVPGNGNQRFCGEQVCSALLCGAAMYSAQSSSWEGIAKDSIIGAWQSWNGIFPWPFGYMVISRRSAAQLDRQCPKRCWCRIALQLRFLAGGLFPAY